MFYKPSKILEKIADPQNHVVVNPIGVSLTVDTVHGIDKHGEYVEVEKLTEDKINEIEESNIKEFQELIKVTKEFLDLEKYSFLFDSFIDEDKKKNIEGSTSRIKNLVDKYGSIENVESKGIEEIKEESIYHKDLLNKTDAPIYILQNNSRYLVTLEQGIQDLDSNEFGFFQTTKEAVKNGISVESFFVTEDAYNLEVFINTGILNESYLKPILVYKSIPIIDFMIGRVEE